MILKLFGVNESDILVQCHKCPQLKINFDRKEKEYNYTSINVKLKINYSIKR